MQTDRGITLRLKGSTNKPAELALEPETATAFKTVLIGAEVERILRVENNGGTPAKLKFSSISERSGFKLTAVDAKHGLPTCAEVLPAGSKCAMGLRFAPRDRGAAEEKFALSYDTGLQSLKLDYALSGEGVRPATIASDVGSRLDFGKVNIGERAQKTVRLENRGDVEATELLSRVPAMGSEFGFQGGEYPGKDGDCRRSLAPGKACSLVFEFAPRAPGDREDTAELRYHNGITSVGNGVSLKGRGEGTALPMPADPARSISSDPKQ